MEEAEKRDHRTLGKELDLFMLCDEGPGFPFFLPKGMALKNALIDYWREIHYPRRAMWRFPRPIIMNRHLWETSGHWDHYKDNMYTTEIDDEDYCIKPMNCPGGVMVYRSRSPTATGNCPCGWASWALCTGMRLRARSTA